MSQEGDFAWGRLPAPRPSREAQGQERLVWALGERVKELAALHEVARLMNQAELSISETLQAVANLIPPAFQFPEKTQARIRYAELTVSTTGFVETPCSLRTQHALSDGAELELRVSYTQMEGTDPASAFLPEEFQLVRSIVELLAGTLNRRSAQERLELAVTSIGAGVWEMDLASGRVTWSAQLERLLGLAPGEFGGTRAAFREMVHPDDLARMTQASQLALETPNTPYAVEMRVRAKDGSYRWLATTGKVVRDSRGQPYQLLGLASDCTARRALEERLQQAQRMEAVGGLAAGIAHDFNNVLSVVISYAELVLLDLADQSPMRADVQEIKTAAFRASELTRHLLAFSRQQVLQPRVFDLNKVLAELQKMLRRLISEDIELTISLAPEVGRVHADPGQIEQVIVNLVVNARDAMPKGGGLALETANVELDESYTQLQVDVQPGPYVMLAVSDTGTGMTPEVRARIFEPFFTTKEQGKGTGLGLATVFGIVRQSGGHIAVYSELGKGTAFKVYLPRVDRPAEVSHSSAQTPQVLTGSEMILLVEDEAQVRAVASRILRGNGYEVLEAQNGGEALLLCEKHGTRLRLLLTDVVLPLLSGRQLAERLSGLFPQLKVLYMSGYTDDAIIRHGILDPGVSFIQKPLTPNELLRKVRTLLDEA